MRLPACLQRKAWCSHMLNVNGNQPGVIRHRARNLQVNDFRGLRYGKITPTDIDGALDFDGRLFVFVEAKFIGTPIGRGQELFLERVVDALDLRPSRFALGIVADHAHPSDHDIDFSSMVVRKSRYRGRWQFSANRLTTVREAIDAMVLFVENRTGKPLYTRGAA